MNRVRRLLLCLSLLAMVWMQAWVRVDAQVNNRAFSRFADKEIQLPFTSLPSINTRDFTNLVFPTLRRDLLLPPLIFTNDTAAMLHSAISRKMGIRYRFYGTDDRGYDCSGFVWRVFQDAGADFERVAARTLWRQLPAASGDETRQFGTLVFFNGLKHVGIVRDAYTFYHSSRSQGVTVSTFTGYWGKRITGFRRAPGPLIPEPIKISE